MRCGRQDASWFTGSPAISCRSRRSSRAWNGKMRCGWPLVAPQLWAHVERLVSDNARKWNNRAQRWEWDNYVQRVACDKDEWKVVGWLEEWFGIKQ